MPLLTPLPSFLSNFVTLVLVLTPLFIGFTLPTTPKMLQYSERLLGYLVYVILTLIGIELSQVEGLGAQIGSIMRYVTTLAVLTIVAGLLSLMIFDRLRPWRVHSVSNSVHHKVSLHGSLVQVSCVGLGYVIGKVLPPNFMPPEHSMTALLMLLILLVGVGLKGSGVTLREVLLNKRGLQVSVLFTLSVLLSGMVFAWLFEEVSLAQGLALSSGFGWYSLSAIVMTDSFGAVWGSVALFNDLLREFAALLFIPVLMRRYPSAAVGLGGATSLDFTLPVIQRSGGLEVVPLAISFGFIINVLSPVLMVGFAAIGKLG